MEKTGIDINPNTISDGNIVNTMKVSVIIPAFNEAECIGSVLHDVFALKDEHGHRVFHEVIVVDNASTDATASIANNGGATVITEHQQGYGQACWTGVLHASGDILLFIDGDGSANVADSVPLLAAINAGNELAIGIRSHPEPGAMSLSQRFGNVFACWLIRRIWKVPVTDLGPLRAITRSLYDRIRMQDRAFGWTVEMQIKADQLNANVANIPVSWHRRSAGHSKISGTLQGVVGAGFGIIRMIARLWWQQRHTTDVPPLEKTSLRPQLISAQTRSDTISHARRR